MEKLKALRNEMAKRGIDTVIITKKDPHQSAYSPAYWNGVQFISGFSGSNGVVVVSQTTAGLWTDGRYNIQAARELEGSGINVFIETEPGTPNHMEYANGVVAFDGRTLSMKKGMRLLKKQLTLKTDEDILNNIWADRPPLSKEKLFHHNIEYCGQSHQQKLAALREGMAKEKADLCLICSLDDIAWLFNLRGRDTPSSALFAAYAVVGFEVVALFVDLDKASGITSEGFLLKPYEAVAGYLQSIGQNKSILLNPNNTPFSLYQAIKHFKLLQSPTDITTKLKAIKNPVELKNLELVNVRDGAAMVRLIMWLKERIAAETITECDVANKITALRAADKRFLGPGFDTIAAYMANAAMMHYNPRVGQNSMLKPEGVILIDSGGLYLDGATDITRTIALGPVSAQMKKDFTLVLKAHIALAQTIFLYGATGSNLDTIPRKLMWDNCLDYKSGTGHGLGFCLNVHEGPQKISMQPNPVKLEAGMVVTNEPGVYREGEYGIRTENTLRVVEHKENAFGKFLRFETFSYCPIDRELIEPSMLTEEEKNWLSAYHSTVYKNLSPILTDEERDWLHKTL